MLFDSISFKNSNGVPVQVATDADILIRADIKNFFTMQFDSTDIVTQMKAYRIEPFAALASLNFYLKILFFRISLDLETDVQFFKDSAHIPMVITIPRDANQRLNRKSGVLYSFALSENMREIRPVKMPVLNPDKLSIQEGLEYCDGNICSYEVSFQTSAVANKVLTLMLKLPRRLAEFGMIPRFVVDVGDSAPAMQWSMPRSQRGMHRVGLYLEVSGLPKSQHPWDVWLQLGDAS